MSAAETWTVGKLLTWTTEYLKKSGSDSPRLDAEVLLSQSRDCRRIELYTAFDEEPSEEVKAKFRAMVKRRAEGAPVAYLVGHKEFYSLDFEVTPDVLIPRPETEHLVVEALDQAKALRTQRGSQAQPLRLADVGTGSGCVAIAVAKHLPDSQVLAIDVSEEALEVARRNALKHALDPPQLEFAQSNLLEGLEPELQFDLILSNPPYVSEPEYEALDTTVRQYEPRQALVGGPRGYELIVRLLTQAAERLVPDGCVVLEFSPMLAESLDAWVGDIWQEPRVIKDLAGLPRIVTLKKRA
ncbi:peptide chain release factor N(5)-glutamine methyltransferase [Aureliella helgolandensis]|uniref:Release factor glutamine methyltransferase n=1 Tax=Aureliella helgolandensis TaxID=2527968 RepID=A0A518GFY6_9BACT|nr:peptide chain release factor N(5)-glutamine methyltransferase [Aureliella helgolandensis]QDV27490.1 Release factor glutamine methyltransferase [Aureliella helgolandensis]